MDCLVGAIDNVSNVAWSNDLLDIVFSKVFDLTGDYLSEEGWNDEEGRTEQEVLDLLMDAEQEFEELYPDILKK